MFKLDLFCPHKELDNKSLIQPIDSKYEVVIIL